MWTVLARSDSPIESSNRVHELPGRPAPARTSPAAFLHDVGHLTMSDGEALETPGHAEAGEKTVRAADFSDSVAAAVRNHHERWDGTGTPDGLAGDKIPLNSRILALAETYEALTAGRGVERMASADAIKLVTEKGGTEFDAALVEALGRSRDSSPEPTLPSVALPAVATAS